MISIYALPVQKILPPSILREMRFKDKIKPKYNGIFTVLKAGGD
jgi:hypothetical protein